MASSSELYCSKWAQGDAASCGSWYGSMEEEDSQKMVNMMEKEDFMNGVKDFAIISEAASTGLELRRRSADKAIQQFGRSHRSNQSSAPIYCMLVTQCGGEYRFAGAVAKRLQSLGALVQERTVEHWVRSNGTGGHCVSVEAEWNLGTWEPMYDVDNRGSASAVPRFLNRLLGMPLQDQTLIFDYFSQTLDATIKQARSAGKFEEAIEVVKSGVVSITSKQELHKDEKTDAATYLVELKIDDGLSWVNALEYRDKELAEHPSSGKSASALPSAGFYVSSHSSNYNSTGHPTILLATEVGASYADNKKSRSFRLRRPNQTHGWIIKEFELKTKFRLLKEESEAQNHWEFWFEHLEKGCMHGPNCVRRKQEGSCNFGSRSFNKYIVSGGKLQLWLSFNKYIVSGNVLPIMKTLFNLDDGQTIVGLNLIREDADMLLATLGAH
eukprot:gene2561-2587_t